jgi:hypothetical protein
MLTWTWKDAARLAKRIANKIDSMVETFVAGLYFYILAETNKFDVLICTTGRPGRMQDNEPIMRVLTKVRTDLNICIFYVIFWG